MVWVAFYIPVAVYMCHAFTSRLEPLSWAIVFAVILGFCIVEWSMARNDRDRPRATMAILCLTLGSLLGGMAFR